MAHEVASEGLRAALERLLANAERIFDKKPVRDWGETLAEARAALAAAPERAALDVERLADAMDNLYEQRWGVRLPPASTTIGGEYADQIAAEYERLAAHPARWGE